MKAKVHLYTKYCSFIYTYSQKSKILFSIHFRGRRGGDRIVVGVTTTCAISAYHH